MNTITIGEMTIDLDSPCKESHSTKELLHRIIGMLKQQQKQIQTIGNSMITPAQLQASSDALTTAVTGAIALIGNPGAATPDATVLAFQTAVDAQTARLNAAEAPPPPPPPTP